MIIAGIILFFIFLICLAQITKHAEREMNATQEAARMENTESKTERGCFCDYGCCDCGNGGWPDMGINPGKQVVGSIVFDCKPDHLKYPEEVKMDKLIQDLDKLNRPKFTRGEAERQVEGLPKTRIESLVDENKILRKNIENYKRISGADELLELKRRNSRQSTEIAQLREIIRSLKLSVDKKPGMFMRLWSWMQS